MNKSETTNCEQETERTKVLEQSGLALETIICHTVSDYLHALNNPTFASHLGGADNVLKELIKLSEKWETSVTPAKAALHKMIDELPSSFSEEDCLFLAAIIGSFSALPPAALLQQLHSDCGPVSQGEMIKRTCIPSKGSEKDAKLQEILPDQFDPDTRTCQMNPEQRAQAATLEKMAGKLVGFDLPGDSS